MSDFQSIPPQTVFNWLGGVLAGLLSVLYGAGAWMFKRHSAKVDALETSTRDFISKREIAETYATRNELKSLELRAAEFISRAELGAHMAQLSDDRERMHQENLLRMDSVRQELSGNRETMREDLKEVRDDIRSVHERIDQILTGRHD